MKDFNEMDRTCDGTLSPGKTLLSPLNDSERKEFVRKWIAANRRRLGAGLGFVALALPLMAHSQGEQFVDAASIEGVASVSVGADGVATITLVNGQQVIVPAGQVQVIDGSVLISASAAQVVAEAGAVAAAAAAPAGAGAALAAGAVGLGLAAALGSSDTTEAESVTIGAVAGDGILNRAEAAEGLTVSGTVSRIDDDSFVIVTLTGPDGEEVASQQTTVTDGAWSVTFPPETTEGLADGSYTLNASAREAEEEDDETVPGDEIASGSVTLIVDQTPPEIEIDTIAGDDVINAAEQQSDLTVTGTTDAEDGQEVTVTFAGETYTGTVSDGQWSVTVPAEDLAGLADGAEIEVTATVSDAAGNPSEVAARTIATDFTPPEIAINPVAGDDTITLVNQGADLEITGTTDAEDGQTVTLNFNGTEVTGTVAGGAWSVTIPQAVIDGLEDEAEVTVSASVDDAAGNTGMAEARTVATDFSQPSISIAAISGDDIINAAESQDDITLSGSTTNALEGAEVAITVTGEGVDLELTATVGADGSWSTSFAAPAADNETFTVSATVTSDGITSELATREFTTDYTPPEIAITTPIAGDDVINVAERDAGIEVAGTTDAEDGQEVTVSLNGAAVATAAVAGGAWSATIPASALAGLDDGVAVTVSADVEDAAGNPAEPASATVETDFTPPALTIDTPGDDGLVEASSDFEVTGTTDGAEVDVIFRGETYPADVAEDGTWSATIPAAALAGLAAGATVEVEAMARDAAGNTADATSEIVTFEYEAARTYLIESGRDGGVVTLEILLDPRFELPGDGGFNLGETVNFDTSQITYLSDPAPTYGANLLGITNAEDAEVGSVTFGGIGFNPGEPLVRFSMNIEDGSAPIQLGIVSDGGGDYTAILGTDDADDLVATRLDTTIRGRGGDDTIDVSAGGVNTIIFEPTVADNGRDEVTGFTLGGDTTPPDRIGFAGLDPAELRGNGTDAEIIAAGSAIGANTGLVIFTTAIPDDEVEAAIAALGLDAGDVIYAIGGGGTDAELVRLTMPGDGSAAGEDDIETLAEFRDIGDLSAFTGDNILGFNLVT